MFADLQYYMISHMHQLYVSNGNVYLIYLWIQGLHRPFLFHHMITEFGSMFTGRNDFGTSIQRRWSLSHCNNRFFILAQVTAAGPTFILRRTLFYAPWYIDIIIWDTMFITKFPDVMGKLGYILVIGIGKWCFVIPPSCLEITLSHSIVVFGGQEKICIGDQILLPIGVIVQFIPQFPSMELLFWHFNTHHNKNLFVLLA